MLSAPSNTSTSSFSQAARRLLNTHARNTTRPLVRAHATPSCFAMANANTPSAAAAADQQAPSRPAAAAAGAANGLSTDAIRRMLKEQKRHCSSLHANPLFQEFWRRSKPPASQDAQPPVIEDLEAEGQARLFDVIRSAAEAREADPAGVWARFGQPYACLGQPQQLDTSAAALLPHLNRDDIAAAAAAPNKQQQQQMQRRGGGGHRVSRTGSAGPLPGVLVAAAAAAVAAVTAAGDGKAQAASAAAHNTSSSSSSKQADAAKLLQHKTVMHFSTVDRLEAAFPQAAVRQADRRQRAAKVQPRRFFDKSRADADLADAAASYGHHTLPSKALPGHQLVEHHQTATAAAAAHAAAAAASRDAHTPAHEGSRASRAHAATTVAAAAAAAPGDSGARHAFFITQQVPAGSAAAAAPQAARRMSVSMVAADPPEAAAGRAERRSSAAAHYAAGRESTTSTATAEPFETAAAAAAQRHTQQHVSAHSEPRFGPITELTMQPAGNDSSSSPVIAWHNEFVGVRRAGYAALQQTLWQRSQDRAAARGEPETGAHLSRSLLQQLGQAGGRFQPGWVPGTSPESPFARSTAQQQQQQAAGAAALAAEAAAAASSRLPMKPAEVELLEQFYSSLCSLVEQQRLSDPLSLTLVHKVKALLEGGTFLQPAMLQACVDCVADFSSSCGLSSRHNRFVLPLLTFVRKCTGVSSQEFESMVQAAGVAAVLYQQQQQQHAATGAEAAVASWREQQQQLKEIPEDASEQQQEQQEQLLLLGLQQCSINGSRGSASGSSRPHSSAAAAAAAHAWEAASPASPSSSTAAPAGSRGANNTGLGLQLEGCCSPGHSPGPSTARGGCSSRSSSGGGAVRGPSGSGGTTGRSRAASSSGGGVGAGCDSGRQAATAAADLLLEGPTVPAINAAAAAAAAEIVQAIKTAPEAVTAAATFGGTGAVGDGSVRVKVPGVAGPVELVSAAQAAAAAAAAAAASAAAGDCSATEGTAGTAELAAAEDSLPDLGADAEGQPLSRRLRHQEGLAEWLVGGSGATAGGADGAHL